MYFITYFKARICLVRKKALPVDVDITLLDSNLSLLTAIKSCLFYSILFKMQHCSKVWDHKYIFETDLFTEGALN